MSDQQKYINKLKGSSILIIGGTSGIGFGVAEAVLEYGASKVIITSSRKSRVSDAVSKLKKSYPSSAAKITGLAYDLGTEGTLEANVKDLFSTIDGTLDHIVYSAGDSVASKALDEVDLDFIKQAGMVRYFAPILVAKYGSKVLSPGPASSITLSTGSVSQRPIPNWTIVAGYAAGLHGLTRNLALDLKPIRVNLISPGFVDTELWNGLGAEQRKATVQSMAESSATGRAGQVVDVVEAYLYCMRDHNVTGSVISTNSGQLLTSSGNLK